MISAGLEELNNLLVGYENITTIYGEAGSGKTTLCLLAVIEQALSNKKTLFIDTESNFSTERFEQILNGRNKDSIKNILVLKANNFNVQHNQIKNLEGLKNISLIVIDSLTHHYRRLHRREPEIAEAMLGKQLSVLNKISKNNIPVLITSQVYSNMQNDIVPLGKDILIKFSNKIIKLEKTPRKIVLEKPIKKEIDLKIINEGIKIG